MITVHFVSHSGASTTLKAQRGQSVMQVAVGAGLDGVAADCGGLLTCATCHVMVREPHASRLPAPEAEEQSMLEFTASPRGAHSRLSCQIVLTDEHVGITVDLPASQY